MPTPTPVKVTEQLPEDRVQLELTMPTAVFDEVKLTGPVGVVGLAEVSVTVAVHVEVWLTLIDAGLHTMLVLVVWRGSTDSSMDAEPVPPLLVAATVTVKLPAAVYACVSDVTDVERVLFVPSPHITTSDVRGALLFTEKDTVTVWPTIAGLGDRLVMETTGGITITFFTLSANVPVLVMWVGSPLYVPVTVALPTPTPVKVTEQLPEDRVQLVPIVPTAVFDDVKLTEPVGVFEVTLRSVTVAVHVEVPPMLMLAGLHATLVEVLSFTTGGTPAVANALRSITPLTDAPASAISGSTAAPWVTSIQSLVPATL